MNTRISFRITLFVSLIILAVCCQTSNAQIPVILRAWAVTAGNSDSTFKSPIVSDEDYTYVATTNFETPTGFNILIVKYDKEGRQIWTQTWTGPGAGLDQPSDMAESDSSLYICGITYTSSGNNYDFVTLRVDKGSGAIMWDTTFNGSASSYDVATAIDVNDDAVYITGTTNGTGTSLDYMTIKYNKTNGAEFWHEAFDYNGLMDIAFAIEIKDDSDIVVTGGSQNSITDWDYQTIEYDDHGNILVQSRASGTGAGFDRAQAAKSDAEGNIYVTGATVNNSNYDIETVKITAAGIVAWQYKKDFNAEDDIGNDLIVDRMGNVYVCGQSKNSGSNEFIVMKLDSTGHEQWSTRIGVDGREYIATKMCFDSWGNIIATGSSPNPNDAGNTDFLTVGFDTDGNEIWRDNYDGSDHGNDKASDITADANGNIFVTGQAWTGSELETVTIKYRTDYYTELPQVDSPAVAYLFYPNSGQIVDDLDSSVVDSVHYYTIHHYPQLYFGYGVMNMVWSHIDRDTSTTDSIERVDMSFYNSTNPTKAFLDDAKENSGYLNYFLPQCPNGITSVTGSGKLLYTDVWNNIDVLFSSNKGGLKLYFICKPGSDPSNALGLQFQGQSTLKINQNWGLQIVTLLGNYTFEKPQVYTLDSADNQTSVSWQLNWILLQSDVASFSQIGTYDATKTLVIEISKPVPATGNINDQGLCWSTYFGGDGGGDYSNGITTDQSGNQYIVGSTTSPDFPVFAGIKMIFLPDEQIFLARFDQMHRRIWSTYYGGTLYDQSGYDVKTKSNGDVYIVGYTNCGNFNHTYHSGAYIDSSANGSSDGFISCIDSTGRTIKWSTYFGGPGLDQIFSLDFDDNDNLYITGRTSGGIPLDTPSGAFKQSFGGWKDALVAKFNNNDSLVWSTYYGGGGDDWGSSIKCDQNGNIFIHGETYSSNFPTFNPGGGAFIDSSLGGSNDNFILKFNSSKQRQWSTLIGGSGDEFSIPLGQPSQTNSIAFDSQKNIYIVGTTSSSDFPLAHSTGFYDSTNTDYGGYLMKFSNSNYSKLWSTYISGGQGQENLDAIAIDNNDKVFVAGSTSDTAFWLHQQSSIYYQDTLQGIYSPYAMDACLLAFDKSNNLIYGSYFGGYQTHAYGEFISDMTVKGNKLYFTGYTTCQSGIGHQFPLFDPGDSAYFDSTSIYLDAFISEICIENVIGIDELQNRLTSFDLYPNPSNGFIYLNFNLSKSEKLTVFVYDDLGREVKSTTVNGMTGENKLTMNLQNIESGLYFIQLRGNEYSSSMRLIKLQE